MRCKMVIESGLETRVEVPSGVDVIFEAAKRWISTYQRNQFRLLGIQVSDSCLQALSQQPFSFVTHGICNPMSQQYSEDLPLPSKDGPGRLTSLDANQFVLT
jgi:hypothetical protein